MCLGDIRSEASSATAAATDSPAESDFNGTSNEIPDTSALTECLSELDSAISSGT